MITKYLLNGLHKRAEIKTVQVSRETEKCVFIMECQYGQSQPSEVRHAKHTEWVDYYDTWDDAHNTLSGLAARKLSNAKANLADAASFVFAVNHLIPPGAPSNAS